jgi:hypothetical protein
MLPDREHAVEAAGPTKSGFSATAAFLDLDKALIARSSTLAFGPSFYRHSLLSRADMMRGALAQLRYRVAGADHRQMEKLKAHVSQACRVQQRVTAPAGEPPGMEAT